MAKEIVQNIKTPAYNLKQFIVIIFGCLILFLLPLPPGLSEEGRRTLVLVLLAIILWIKEILPPALTGLLLMISFPFFKVLSYEKAVEGLGSTSAWLLMGVFIISAAMQESGLDKRIALHLLNLSKGNSKTNLLMIILTTTLFLFLIPTGSGRIAIMLPISLGMLNAMQVKKGSNIGKAMLLGISYASLIGSIGLMTSAISTVYAIGIFESMLGYSWSYIKWFIVMFPGVLIIDLLIWVIFLKIFPPEIDMVPGGLIYIRNELTALGKISKQEKKIFLLMAIMITLWIFGDYINISVSQSCLLIALATMLPGIEIISWKKGIQSVNWSVILLLGSSLALVEALTETQAINWLTENIFSILKGFSPSLIGIIITLMIVIIRFGFPSLLSMTATTLPLIFTLAFSFDINPVWLGLVGINASVLGIFLPTQALTLMTSYSAGFYTIKDMCRAGFFTALAAIIVFTLMANFYWPLLGIKP